MLLPAIISLAGAGALGWSVWAGSPWWIQLPLVLLAAGPLWMMGELLYAATRPRIGYEPDHLLVFFEPSRPERVPIELVECFFLGQGDSALPALRGREPETQNVIVRLAEAASEWKHRDVRPAIGHWCESYITLRGSWCEPITPGLMRRLNERLAQVHRERKATPQSEGDR
jgi:hypothetical protein